MNMVWRKNKPDAAPEPEPEKSFIERNVRVLGLLLVLVSLADFISVWYITRYRVEKLEEAHLAQMSRWQQDHDLLVEIKTTVKHLEEKQSTRQTVYMPKGTAIQ